MTSAPRLRVTGLPPGSHVGLFLESDREEAAVLLPFLREALRRNGKVLYVTDMPGPALEERLRQAGADPKSILSDGEVKIVPARKVFTPGNVFDPDSALQALREEAQAAAPAGLHAVLDYAWLADAPAGSERIMEFDARLNGLAAAHRAVLLCQFDQRRIPANLLMSLLGTHPLIVKNGELVRSFFYVQPEELRHGDRVDIALQRCLSALLERKHAEERLTALIERSPVPTLAVDSAGNVISYNAACAALTGYAREEIANASALLEHLYPDPAYREQITRHMELAMSGQGPTERTHIITRGDGTRKTIEIKLSFHDDGHVAQLIDVTEREKAQEQLKQAKEFLDKAVNAIHDPFFVKDEQHRWVLLNDAACRGMGRPREELIGKTNYDLFDKEYADAHWAADTRVFEHGGLDISEQRRPWRDSDRIVSVAKNVFTDSVTGKRFIAGTSRDITEIKRTEEALRESQANYDRLAEHVTDFIWAVRVDASAEPRFTFVTPSIEKLLGYKPEDAAQLRMADILTPKSLQIVQDDLQAERSRGERSPRVASRTFELELVRKDASAVWCECTVSFVHGPNGAVTEIFGVTRDRSERKRMESELRKMTGELVQAGKLAAIGQLAAGLCHELNQPLTAMQTYIENAAELLKRGEPNSVASNLDLVSGLLQRAAEIVRRLKTLSRKTPERREPVSLNDVVQTVCLFLLGRAERETADILLDLTQEDFVVSGDVVQLEQVCMNLIGNALDAVQGMPERKVYVSTRGTKKRVRLSVRDTGPGIPKDTLPKLFEPFFTVKPDGLGLGLPISQKIVKAHGGTLKAANHPGGGAAFTVSLPLCAPAP
ncbi:MAG: PAS domain S-box protein [Kiritimatiellae bacterium]|nr:PAS domain S-box protein [Kiritimatiellia bacterium]